MGDQDGASASNPLSACLSALNSASTDTEKLSAMFLVPRMVKAEHAASKADRRSLVEAIGFSFLARMLRSQSSPEEAAGDGLMYRSVALSVLSCFAGDDDIMTEPSVLFNVPVLLDIVADADNEIYEENLLVINDAYAVLAAVAATEKGRSALVANRGVARLCRIHVEQTFQCEKAVELLLYLVGAMGPSCWNYHTGQEDFNALMAKFCSDFAAATDESKFELCDTIRVIIRSFPKTCFTDDDPWLVDLQRGLRDVLFSRIGKAQRDPAIKLVSAVVEASRDFEWCVRVAAGSGSGKDKKANKKRDEDGSRFLLIVMNLSCIELIMHLEDKSLEAVADAPESDRDLLMSYYVVLENAVTYMSSDHDGAIGDDGEEKPQLEDVLDEKQRQQVYTALKNAFSAVLKFVKEISDSHRSLLEEKDGRSRTCNQVIVATIRLLCAWLAEESAALRDEVYAVLPFVTRVAVQTYEEQKEEKLASLSQTCKNAANSGSSKAPSRGYPDVLRFLTPGLCHLVAEDKSRKILMQFKLTNLLASYLDYHWNIYDMSTTWIQEQESKAAQKKSKKKKGSKPSGDDDEISLDPTYLLDNVRFDSVNSRYALVNVCNVIMNVVVLEPKAIAADADVTAVFNWIVRTLPTLKNADEQLVLYGNMSVLGLLILKNRAMRPKESDFSIFKFIQSVIRFLWDAHNCDDSPKDGELQLGVSFDYILNWNDLEQLWFLGMQILNSLMESLPWIREFVVDSGWSADVLKSFSLISRGEVNPSVQAAFEDLLCTVAKGGAAEELKKSGAVDVANKHGMRELQKVLLIQTPS